jgi:hypothetical protein
MHIPSWLKAVAKIAPTILALTPAAPIAPWVALGIQAAEGIPQASGAQKLEIAKVIAKVGVAAVNAQAGSTVINPAAADELLASSINAVVAATNLAHKDPS